MPAKTIYSVCGMCPVRCPIEVDVENEQCRFIQGNRQVPSIRGALCTRGAAGIPFVRDDERPQFPMLRQGERGEGRWQRLSWEEAFSLAAEKIAAVRELFDRNNIPEHIRDAKRGYQEDAFRHLDAVQVPEERKAVIRSFMEALLDREY